MNDNLVDIEIVRYKFILIMSYLFQMEPEVVEAELVLPTHMKFKKVQMYEKYPKGQARVRWKHLKQIIQAENYQNYPPNEPNCEFYLKCETYVQLYLLNIWCCLDVANWLCIY